MAPPLATPCAADRGTGDWVIVSRPLDPTEAHILRNTLEAAGVAARVDDAHVANCFGHLAYALEGVPVRVMTDELVRAREILAQVSAGEFCLGDTTSTIGGEESNPCQNGLGHPAEQSSEPSLQEQRIFAFTCDTELARHWGASAPRLPGFRLAPLVFGPVWFFYRKLFRTGALLFALEVCLLLAAVNTASRSAGVSLVLLRLVVACCAEVIYYGRALNVIRREVAAVDDEAKRQSRLRQAGGVNFPAALGALLAYRLITYPF